MNKNIEEYFGKYKLLRDTLDQHSSVLEKEHAKHLQCKKGCDLCCMDYNIFPVEFHFILNKLNENNFYMKPIENSGSLECIFLQDHTCRIYDDRPLICRNHGLPLLYANDEGKWELSTCELNFTNFDFEDFTSENTFPQDNFNSKLFLLNKAFIAEFKEVEYGEFDLIPIKKLIEKN